MKLVTKLLAEERAAAVYPIIEDLDSPAYHRVLALLAWRRPWRPEHRGWQDVLDQSLHFLYAAVVLLPVAIHPAWWTGAISGFVLGAIREVWQFYNWDLRIVMFGDRLKDAFFFSVGGAVVVLVAQLIGR